MTQQSHGTFHWNELVTRDVEAAKQYYADTLGWRFETRQMQDGPYHVASVDGEAVAGVTAMPERMPSEAPPYWLAYVVVDDIDQRIEAAGKTGAKVSKPPYDIEGVGRVAVIEDPAGALIGMITPA